MTRRTTTGLAPSLLASSSLGPLCAVCRHKRALYSCPACNLRYCSSDCYRDPKHDVCSEAFYRKSLLEDIKSSPERTSEEKRAMLEILQRLEDSTLGEEEPAIDEEEEEGMALQLRLAGLDIDSLTPSDLLKLLSPAQRADFEQILKDPEKAAELLDAAAAQDLVEEPWWAKVEDEDPPDLPSDLPKAVATAQLAFNVVAILLAYCYCVRSFGVTHLGRSNERAAIVKQLKQLLPLLFETSQLSMESLAESIAYVCSRLTDDLPASELRLLLEDVAVLLRRKVVSTTGRLMPLSNAIKAFSDMAIVLSGPAKRKVLYYTSWLQEVPPSTFSSIQIALANGHSGSQGDEGLATQLTGPISPVQAELLIEEIG